MLKAASDFACVVDGFAHRIVEALLLNLEGCRVRQLDLGSLPARRLTQSLVLRPHAVDIALARRLCAELEAALLQARCSLAVIYAARVSIAVFVVVELDGLLHASPR